MSISNDPVAADELGSGAPQIGNGDGVREYKTVARLIGLLRQVIDLRLYYHAMLIDCFHARHLNRFSLMSQGVRAFYANLRAYFSTN